MPKFGATEGEFGARFRTLGLWGRGAGEEEGFEAVGFGEDRPEPESRAPPCLPQRFKMAAAGWALPPARRHFRRVAPPFPVCCFRRS